MTNARFFFPLFTLSPVLVQLFVLLLVCAVGLAMRADEYHDNLTFSRVYLSPAIGALGTGNREFKTLYFHLFTSLTQPSGIANTLDTWTPLRSPATKMNPFSRLTK